MIRVAKSNLDKVLFNHGKDLGIGTYKGEGALPNIESQELGEEQVSSILGSYPCTIQVQP